MPDTFQARANAVKLWVIVEALPENMGSYTCCNATSDQIPNFRTITVGSEAKIPLLISTWIDATRKVLEAPLPRAVSLRRVNDHNEL
jgi:hypothetical protein